jgi:hypothetical protein
MRLKWARIRQEWQVVNVEGKFFSVCGNANDGLISKARSDWGKDFKWGEWLKKPQKYKRKK